MLKTIENLRGFLKDLPRQFKVMIVRSSVTNFISNLNPYSSLYIVALGATETQLGILTSVASGLAAVLAMLTGWISDRGNRKRICLMGASIGILAPITYAVSPNWAWLVLAFVLVGLSDGIIQPAWNAMYANSVSNRKRGTTYGLANMFMLAPALAAPLIGAAIVLSSGGLTAEGIRPIYWLQAVTLLGVWLFIWKFLKREKTKNDSDTPMSIGCMLKDYKEVLKPKGVRAWILMKGLGSVSVGMASPFWMLYAAIVHHASVMIMALMVTFRQIAQLSLSSYAGRLADKNGRKRMIISGRVIMYLGVIIFLLSNSDWYLIFAWILLGISDATAIAWSAESDELAAEACRSRMTAMNMSAFNALAVPSAILGGYLWENVSPIAPFIVMAVIDGIIRMAVIYLFVPESKKPFKGKTG